MIQGKSEILMFSLLFMKVSTVSNPNPVSDCVDNKKKISEKFPSMYVVDKH